jgi:hypothetical protein
VAAVLAAVITGLKKEPIFAPVRAACVSALTALENGKQLCDLLEKSTTENDDDEGNDDDDDDDAGMGAGSSLFEPLRGGGGVEGGDGVTVEAALEYAVRSTVPKIARRLMGVLRDLREQQHEQQQQLQKEGGRP